MKIKGILTWFKYDCWESGEENYDRSYDDVEGGDICGYSFKIRDYSDKFNINEETPSGYFFDENKEYLFNKEIEFTCDKWQMDIVFSDEFMNKMKNEKLKNGKRLL